MRAVVMAGGLGTRLRPLTLTTPKAMLPVAGRPVIDRLLEKLAEAGVQDVTLATGYLAEVIEDYVQDGARWGLRVDYVRQVQPMGTAGALSLLADKSQPVLVVNGDKVIECAVDLCRVAGWTLGTDAVVGTSMQTLPYGMYRGGRLIEKPTLYVNVGVYALAPSLIPTEVGPLDMPAVLNVAPVLHNVVFEGYVLDIGTPESYEAACARLSS